MLKIWILQEKKQTKMEHGTSSIKFLFQILNKSDSLSGSRVNQLRVAWRVFHPVLFVR